MPIKVLIIEDSLVTQQLLAHILSSDPDICVVGIASDGKEGLAMVGKVQPDVITMDIILPHMDGFEVTRRIMEEHPLPVVIVSASWQPDEVATTFRAMEAGAVAAVGKPHGPMHSASCADAERLIHTVKAMSEVKVVRRWPRNRTRPPAPTPVIVEPWRQSQPVRVVAIGASTGGPQAIHAILSALRCDFPAPILIVQHIAVGFLQGLAEWLTRTTPFQVSIAMAGETALAGRAYLAPDHYHMGIDGGRRIVLTAGDAGDAICPSVGNLFLSVAEVYGPSAAGVLLTGMGRDGAEGLRVLKRAGGLTIAQDRESSVVHGMPGEAIRIGAATYIVNPGGIALVLNESVHAN